MMKPVVGNCTAISQAKLCTVYRHTQFFWIHSSKPELNISNNELKIYYGVFDSWGREIPYSKSAGLINNSWFSLFRPMQAWAYFSRHKYPKSYLENASKIK